MNLSIFIQRWMRYRPFARFADGVSRTLRDAKRRGASGALSISGSRRSSAVLKKREQQRAAPLPPVACAYQGCEKHAVASVNGSGVNLCAQHYVEIAQREADVFCNAQGLENVEDKIAYCRMQMKHFGRGNFETWAKTVTQQTVAILVRAGNKKLLDKLRDAGVIDDYNRMVKT